MTSVCPIASSAPYTIETTASTRTTGVAHLAAPGNSGRQKRIMPNVPTLSSTPTSRTATGGGASAAASGSQVCTGNIGALTAKAKKKPRNISRSAPTPRSRPVSLDSRNPSGPPGPATYRAITATSMTSPPSREYSRNFTAAYCRRGPPNEPIRK